MVGTYQYGSYSKSYFTIIKNDICHFVFLFCDHFVLKILSCKCLPSQATHF